MANIWAFMVIRVKKKKEWMAFDVVVTALDSISVAFDLNLPAFDSIFVAFDSARAEQGAVGINAPFCRRSAPK